MLKLTQEKQLMRSRAVPGCGDYKDQGRIVNS